MLCHNPIDLDVWLELSAVRVGKLQFNNREAIHKIGSVRGAHFDVDKHPLIEMLRRSHMENVSQDSLVQFVHNTGCIFAELADRLLALWKR